MILDLCARGHQTVGVHVVGTGSFSGNFAGLAITRSVSLADIGIDGAYGLSGSADFACGGAPDLTLTFSSVKLQLNRK